MAWFGLGRRRAEAAALEEELSALQAALARCRSVTKKWKGRRRLLATVGAVLILAFGFWLGANRGPLEQSLARLAGVIGITAPPQGVEAADTAYRKADYPVALRLARPLADEGDARAQYLLGVIYQDGRGTPRDGLEALKWFRLAAAQGDADAQFSLGLTYAEGRGVPKDDAEAAEWYRLAADQGYAQAQYNLGVLYATGEGLPQDNVAAHMWFNLAAASFPPSDTRNRNAAVQSRELVGAKLTREQLAEAQKLAREWRPVRRTRHAAGGDT
jgi:hypothetical protein